jgi:hypothetical protein
VTLAFCVVSEVFILGPCCFLFNMPLHFICFWITVKRNSCALSCTSCKLVKVSQVTVCTFFFLLFHFLLFLLTLWYEDEGGVTIEPHFFLSFFSSVFNFFLICTSLEFLFCGEYLLHLSSCFLSNIFHLIRFFWG